MVKILELPYWIYASSIIAMIVWANLEYTGGWQDIAILAIFCVIGYLLKRFDISRPAVLVTYVVAERLEGYIKQTMSLYSWQDLFTRPIFLLTMAVALIIIIRMLNSKNRGLEYV